MRYAGSREEIEKLQAAVDAELGYDKVLYVNVGGGVHRPHELQKTTHFEPVLDETTRKYIYVASKLDSTVLAKSITRSGAAVETVADEPVLEDPKTVVRARDK